MRGPVVLARDARLGGPDVDAVATPKADAERRVPLAPAADRPDGVWMAFRAPFDAGLHDRAGELTLVDYASAGNTWDERSRYRVWLPQILDPSRERRS